MSTTTLAPPATSTASAADRYLADRVMTATPAELTAMLFDGCVGAIRLAMRLQRSGEWLEAVRPLAKAQDIVLELRSTLNHDAGELASGLDALYTYAWSQLLQASTRRDPAAAQAALDVVEPLQLAWREGVLGQQP